VFVGALDPSSSTVVIGAFGQSDAVFHQTYSTTTGNLNNGLYWYNVYGKSFGFSPVQNVYLNSADVNTDYGDLRLSWHIDQGIGGYRAGTMNPSSEYRKVIYRYPATEYEYPSGVQTQFYESDLLDMGMVPCYDASYDSATNQSSFDACISPGDW
jgi:hypothetical protein